jgi:hypothetical protein
LRWPHPSSSFMEDARRPPPFHPGGHHSQKSCPLIKQPRSSFAEAGSRAPVVNSVLALESRGPLRFSAPDPNCWRLVVHKRKRKPSGSKPRSSHKGARKVPADLIGLCFNCFHDDHVSRNYPYPACCLRCREPGHLAQDCSRPSFLLGDRCCRRSWSCRCRQSLQPEHRSQASLAAPSAHRPALRTEQRSPLTDCTPPGSSCSTGRESSLPTI